MINLVPELYPLREEFADGTTPTKESKNAAKAQSDMEAAMEITTGYANRALARMRNITYKI